MFAPFDTCYGINSVRIDREKYERFDSRGWGGERRDEKDRIMLTGARDVG